MKNDIPSFIKQKLEFLFLNEDFQCDASAFRKKWKIPKNGLADTEIENWWQWLIKISDNRMESGKFINERKTLLSNLKRAKNSRNRKAIRNFEKELKKLNKKIPINNFYSEIETIMRKYNLSDNYKNPLKGYLLSNCFSFVSRDNLRFWIEPDKKNKGKDRLFLEIYSETTTKDIQRIWEMIKPLQKRALGYKKGRKGKKRNFFRDKRIYELSKEGLTYPKISKKIKEEFGGRLIMYDEIAKIVQRVRKKIMDK